MHILPNGLAYFNVTDPVPACDRWRMHMPTYRDPSTYRLYADARALWRSKIEWKLTREEAMHILSDVKLASQRGDWGARALLSHFYFEGLGPLPTNKVLERDLDKSVELARQAAATFQPWGLFDLGVAYEHGYGGVQQDTQLAWAYYLKAAQLGSPEAQMTLATAYAKVRLFKAEEAMQHCAYKQGHGAAALSLGVDNEVSKKDFKAAIRYYQDGVKFGNKESAAALELLFIKGVWSGGEENETAILQSLGVAPDTERSNRYTAIYAALQVNPDLKLGRLDQVLPLPPTKLPDWHGIVDAIEPESTEQPSY